MAVSDRGTVSHYREAGVNFLLMDAASVDRNKLSVEGLDRDRCPQLFGR